MGVYEQIIELAAQIDPLISRPCIADPTLAHNAPCVLVDLPRWDGESETLCGDRKLSHTVVVIGQPGNLAELKPVSDLLEETLAALAKLGIGDTAFQPATYSIVGDTLTAEPCIAYEITIERYA